MGFWKAVFSLRMLVHFLPITAPAPRLPVSLDKLEQNCLRAAANQLKETDLTSLDENSISASNTSNRPASSFLTSKTDQQSDTVSPHEATVPVHYIGSLPSSIVEEEVISFQTPKIYCFADDLTLSRSEKIVNTPLTDKRTNRVIRRCQAWIAESKQHQHSQSYPYGDTSFDDCSEFIVESDESNCSVLHCEDSVSQVATTARPFCELSVLFTAKFKPLSILVY